MPRQELLASIVEQLDKEVIDFWASAFLSQIFFADT